MKPSVLRGVEEDKEVMEDASINRPPVVGFMQELKLFCLSVLCTLQPVIQEKTEQIFFFSFRQSAGSRRDPLLLIYF